jgi:hypothetical protein
MSVQREINRINDRHGLDLFYVIDPDGGYALVHGGEVLFSHKFHSEVEEFCTDLRKLLDTVVDKRLAKIHEALGLGDALSRMRLQAEENSK